MKLNEILNYRGVLENICYRQRDIINRWNFDIEKDMDGKTLFERIEDYTELREALAQLEIELNEQCKDYNNARSVSLGINDINGALYSINERVKNVYLSNQKTEFNFNTEELYKKYDDFERQRTQVNNKINEISQIDVSLSDSLLRIIGEYCG